MSKEYWTEQFEELDKALPGYNLSRVTDWNKVMNHYLAMGMNASSSGIVAHWYHEYRSGKPMKDMIRALVTELCMYRKRFRNLERKEGQ